MVTRLLIFGIAKDIVGSSATEIALPENATITDLKNILEERYPRLKQLSTFMIALNNQYATGDELIKSNDEVAIIPPVSGG
ncbi:MAG: molybdopterin converting factor subunit 1 [Bacteroidetes bacterium]|nr:molybdopterin converting factor subunit 1 [Bacteroidota bacterium]